MKAPILLLSLSLLACAPLQHHETIAGDVGEVIFRVVAFPLTLGTSELMLEDQYRREQARKQQYQPVAVPASESLSSCLERESFEVCDLRQRQAAVAEQERQYRHELDLARTQALGQALLGQGISGYPLRSISPPAPLVVPPRSSQQVCFGNEIGSSLWVNCY